MKIIILQGNFPEKYNGTRHNVAFAFGDFLAAKFGASFAERPKFKAEVAEFTWLGEKVLLVKPRTYYNETGAAARAICDFYKLNFQEDLLAIHDDLALDFGVVRVRNSGGSAGNNGLKSLIATFGENFPRVKIGIANELLARMDSADFVLAKFNKAEAENLPQIFTLCEQFAENFVQNRLQNDKKSI